jgi:hypothetical protein
VCGDKCATGHLCDPTFMRPVASVIKLFTAVITSPSAELSKNHREKCR